MSRNRLWKAALKNKAEGEGVIMNSSSSLSTSYTSGPGGVVTSTATMTANLSQPPLLPSSSRPPSITPIFGYVPDQQTPETVPSSEAGGPSTSGHDAANESVPELFADYEARKEEISNAFFQHHTAEKLGEPCHVCGIDGATITTICRECWQRPATCPRCFVNAHRANPTHWAEVWAPERGYFVRHDISTLEGDPYENAIHLGHEGSPCPYLVRDGKQHRFTVVDNNGIHSTRLFFCGCIGAGDQVLQLLRAGLFPATFRRPEMAFTFQLLHTFEVHHLESAESAYDFIGALRHLTDGFFFEAASNPYDQFRDSFKIYSYVVAQKRCGQLHGIDSYFPNRPQGDLTVHCGACLEVGVNTTGEELRITDRRLKHLAQVSVTEDANFRASHFAKNPDVKQISLYKGRAFFPEPKTYRLFVDKATKQKTGKRQSSKQTEAETLGANKATEKSECAYLNAVNKQDKAKFTGCDISGILNVQCAHVFILSCVDLDLGEKFVHGDYAMLRAIQQMGIDKLDPDVLEFIDFLFSYDISCAFCVNALERCKEHMEEYLHIWEKFRWLIPLLHIQNHKDNCTYLYSSAYKESAGHFYGETAEQVWPYSNQFGGQGSQMSHGNRHDLYVRIFNYWNQKKLVGLPSQLYNDLTRADKLRLQKLNSFLGKCETYRDKIALWNGADRKKGKWITMPDKTKEFTCVYRHNPSMLPSQKSIYDALMGQVKADPVYAKISSADKLPSMLNQSVNIRQLQVKTKCTLAAYRKHETPTLMASVNSLREQLLKAFKRLRGSQASFIPQVGDDVASIPAELMGDTPESQPLYMPSDYESSERKVLDLNAIADYERKILRGAAYDTIAKLRTSVRMISALADAGINVSGQDARTRQASQVQDALLQQNILMDFYSCLRNGLVRLGLSEDDPTFRPMSQRALSRKSTTAKRALGDTYNAEGFIHNPGGINSATQRQTFRPLVNPLASSPSMVVGTQSTKPLKRKNEMKTQGAKKQKVEDTVTMDAPPTSCTTAQTAASESCSGTQGNVESAPSETASSEPVDSKDDAGWVWAVISESPDVSNADVEQYLSQGDSVEWFRAEAEMLRWQEEWERKLMEFVRSIRYFERMSEVWGDMAAKALIASPMNGKAAYAKKTSNRYHELASQARVILFQQARYEGKFELDRALAYIQADRARLDGIIQQALTLANVSSADATPQ